MDSKKMYFIPLVLFLILVLFIGIKEIPTALVVKGTNTGTLKVASTPEGAQFFVDGIYGGITPAMSYSLKQGTHKVYVVMEGYQDYTTTVKVYAGKTSYLNAMLNSEF